MLTIFAEGSIASSRKQYALKDGTVRRASPQFRFQTKGGRGKQVCKYVPPRAVARVKELIENGRRYRRLEAEYSQLMTAQSLSSLKTQDPSSAPAPTPPTRTPAPAPTPRRAAPFLPES